MGGTGRPGDDGRALAHLAVLLPGWGDDALAAAGADLAFALTTDAATDAELDARADSAAAYAGNSVFASALLAALGVEGVGRLLATVGSGRAVPAVAKLLASALGSAVPTGPERRDVEAVVDADYLRTDDRYADPDTMATGMALTLASGGFWSGRGPGPAVAADWARQMLRREHAQGAGVVATAPASGSDAGWQDPVTVALGVLADGEEPAESAALLADGEVWQALLSRFWEDGAAALGRVVVDAGREAGEAGARAVRAGLEVIGTGLAAGDPSGWTVSRRTVGLVSPALGRAVASQVEVAVDALAVGVHGRLDEQEAALRGLGYVTLDRPAAAAIERSLAAWSGDQPPSLAGTSAQLPAPRAAIPAAFVAVQEYGQRLGHALDGLEEQQRAVNRESWWNWTLGGAATVASELLRGPAGPVVGLAEGYAAIGLGADGTWDAGVDRGLRFTSKDAVDAVHAGSDPDRAAALVGQARRAFERTAAALGDPRPPTSPDADLLAPLVDAAVGEGAGRLGDRIAVRVRGGAPTGAP